MICVGDAHCRVHHHLRPARPARLGRHQHHAVGATRSVDGRRRSVLQHLYALNILGVDALQAAGSHDAVHHIKRVVGLVDGAGATHAYLHVTARHAAGHHRDARHASLQRVLNARHGLILELLTAHHGHRASQIGLADGAIAYYDHFVQRLAVLMQGHGHVSLSAHRHFHGLISDIGTYQHSLGSDIQFELPVHVGDRTILAVSFLHNINANQRLATGILHDTGHTVRLLIDGIFIRSECRRRCENIPSCTKQSHCQWYCPEKFLFSFFHTVKN